MKKRDYKEYKFNEVFELSEESPSGIVWKVPRKYSNKLNYGRVGKQAGNLRDFNGRQQYYVVSIFGKSFFTHRIAYLLYHGNVDPENDIDHIDGNSLNNSIDNLREVPPFLNSRNSRKRVKGKELETGIYYEELLSRRGTLLKRINAHCAILPNKTEKVNFSVLKYGYETALALAREWRKTKLKEVSDLGMPYSSRHGL
jgi:hypothetical protein